MEADPLKTGHVSHFVFSFCFGQCNEQLIFQLLRQAHHPVKKAHELNDFAPRDTSFI